MTIRQYQTLAKAIADKITGLGGNPKKVRYLKLANGPVTIGIRYPKDYNENPVTFESGESNFALSFDTLSNPNNPNCKFRTLKPGSMSAYCTSTMQNYDLTDFRFDSAQFAKLVSFVSDFSWNIAS